MTTRRKFIASVSVGVIGGLAGCSSAPDSLSENGYEVNLLDSIENATYIKGIELEDVTRSESLFGARVSISLRVLFETERGATPDPDTVTLRQDVKTGAFVDSYSWEDGATEVVFDSDIKGSPVSGFTLEVTKATSGISEQTLEEVDFEIVESES